MTTSDNEEWTSVSKKRQGKRKDPRDKFDGLLELLDSSDTKELKAQGWIFRKVLYHDDRMPIGDNNMFVPLQNKWHDVAWFVKPASSSHQKKHSTPIQQDDLVKQTTCFDVLDSIDEDE